MGEFITTQDKIKMEALKYKMVMKYYGNEVSDSEAINKFDKVYNPQSVYKELSPEQIKKHNERQEFAYICNLGKQIEYGSKIVDPRYENMCTEQAKMHQLDGHNLIQFFNDDLWRIKREQFIEQYIIPKHNEGRDLSQTYNSTEYNQLLALHASNASRANPFVNQLMNDSRYDNNLFDDPVGMQAAIERELARAARMQEKLPAYISDEETQQRRREWTNEIQKQILAVKGGSMS